MKVATRILAWLMTALLARAFTFGLPGYFAAVMGCLSAVLGLLTFSEDRDVSPLPLGGLFLAVFV